MSFRIRLAIRTHFFFFFFFFFFFYWLSILLSLPTKAASDKVKIAFMRTVTEVRAVAKSLLDDEDAETAQSEMSVPSCPRRHSEAQEKEDMSGTDARITSG